MLRTDGSALCLRQSAGGYRKNLSLAARGRHHGRGDGRGPVGPGLADVGHHRGDLLVVQFILPGGHLPQIALAAVEDGGDHRPGRPDDKRIPVVGRKGAGESLAVEAVAIGAIILKDFLALLEEIAGSLGPGGGSPRGPGPARIKGSPHFAAAGQPQGRRRESADSGCRKDL